MQRIIGIAIICFTLIGSTAGKTIATSAADVNQMVNGLNTFGFNLYHKISQPNQNIIISPYSISALLSVLVSGAAENTRAQLIHILHFENSQNSKLIIAVLNKLNHSLNMSNQCISWMGCHFNKLSRELDELEKTQNFIAANAFWADKKFAYRPYFLTSMQLNHAVDFYSVDFTNNPEKSRVTINNWIANNTNGHIQNLLPQKSVTAATRLILTNAIYFKGLWDVPFSPDKTVSDTFMLTDTQSIQVPMMHQQDKFLYSENTDVQLLQLPYSHSSLAMILLLPKAYSNHTLQELGQNLNPVTFTKLLKTLHTQEVIVTLPRFKFESTFNSLDDAVESLGLTDAFNDKANFSHLTHTTLFISRIIQKALIQVDEEGTVAAAATGVAMSTTMVQEPPPVEFNANHPFLFIIYDKQTNLILFMGQVVDPG